MFDLDHLFVVDAAGRPVRVDAPLGIAVVSQSCDASQPGKPSVHVAPVVKVDGPARAEALAGKRIRYAALDLTEPGHFADLETVSTVHKDALEACTRTSGVTADVDVRRFAGTVSRKYGRFAFPDEVVLALDPLRNVLRSKAAKENSPLGKLLTDVYAIRVEAQNESGWLTAPYELTLVVIFREGVLPYTRLDDDLPPEPAGLRAKLDAKPQQTEAAKDAMIVGLLNRADTPDDHRYWLWHHLVDGWARKCEDAADQAGVRTTVASVTAEPIPVDEFPLSRVNNSEDLDLDYLSEPLPRSPGAQP